MTCLAQLPAYKILLLEDDPLMQRFVSLALDETGHEIVCCQNVSQALSALKLNRFDFILTDLMLPGESGLSFIRKLRQDDTISYGAEVIALSAGINAAMIEELELLGVTKRLLKPVSVGDLQAIFVETPLQVTQPSPSAREAIDQYFGGQRTLFEQFKSQSLTLLAADIDLGDRLVAAGAFPSLHQLAHSLKSVLLLLGEQRAHELSLALEHDLALNNPVAIQIARQWDNLRAELKQLIDSRQ